MLGVTEEVRFVKPEGCLLSEIRLNLYNHITDRRIEQLSVLTHVLYQCLRFDDGIANFTDDSVKQISLWAEAIQINICKKSYKFKL